MRKRKNYYIGKVAIQFGFPSKLPLLCLQNSRIHPNELQVQAEEPHNLLASSYSRHL